VCSVAPPLVLRKKESSNPAWYSPLLAMKGTVVAAEALPGTTFNKNGEA
jgi:hypothetical protein